MGRNIVGWDNEDGWPAAEVIPSEKTGKGKNPYQISEAQTKKGKPEQNI